MNWINIPGATSPTFTKIAELSDSGNYRCVATGHGEVISNVVPVVVQPFHPDTINYVARVEAADGQALEPEIVEVWDVFFRAMDDPNHPTPTAATHKEALLAGTMIPMFGARTLAGALIPAYAGMPMPTNVGFVTGDYDRATGLKNANSDKRVDLGWLSDSVPRDDVALMALITDIGSQEAAAIIGQRSGAISGGAIQLSTNKRARARNQAVNGPNGTATGLAVLGVNAWSRHDPYEFSYRASAITTVHQQSSNGIASVEMQLFTVQDIAGTSSWDGRMVTAVGSLSIDLAYMDSCLTQLQSSIAAALA